VSYWLKIAYFSYPLPFGAIALCDPLEFHGEVNYEEYTVQYGTMNDIDRQITAKEYLVQEKDIVFCLSQDTDHLVGGIECPFMCSFVALQVVNHLNVDISHRGADDI